MTWQIVRTQDLRVNAAITANFNEFLNQGTYGEMLWNITGFTALPYNLVDYSKYSYRARVLQGGLEIGSVIVTKGIPFQEVAIPSSGTYTFTIERRLIEGSIKTLPPGTIIPFAGADWILLNPEEGYIVRSEAVTSMQFERGTGNSIFFSPTRSTSVGHYLNNNFFDSIPEKDKAAIQTRTWNVGNRYDDPNRVVEAKIGLISKTELESYAVRYNKNNGFLRDFPAGNWLINYESTGSNKIAWFTWTGTLNTATITSTHGVRPALYIDPNANVSNGELSYNQEPQMALQTTGNVTLYENDILTIEGTAADTDSGDVVMVKYQVNSLPAKTIATDISDGSTPIPFNRKLSFKLGKLYDGDAAYTGTLSEGVAHTLKVWAEDDKGGKSAVQERTFYVVANRPPEIVIDPIAAKSDLIPSDEVTITGTTSDPEGQNVKTRYSINGAPFVQLSDGVPGVFALKVKLDKLKTGENTIQFQVEDTYGFTNSTTVTINKKFNGVPLTHGVARYTQTVPAGGITGLVAWIEREAGDLVVSMEASMVDQAEQERFAAMNPTNTAPIDANIEENEFRMNTEAAKEKVAIKIELSRADAASTAAVKKITGTLG